MLGNWSLNDYFKKEAIEMTMEFFIDVLQMDINRIYVSVFKGEIIYQKILPLLKYGKVYFQNIVSMLMLEIMKEFKSLERKIIGGDWRQGDHVDLIQKSFLIQENNLVITTVMLTATVGNI